jgi:hypothetical protein
MSSEPIDLFISAVEINDHQGVGILLRRYFPANQTAVSLRSRSQYGGREDFGGQHWELRSQFLTLAETEGKLRKLLSGVSVRRILAVPYYREDFVHAVLAKKITGAPLCVFVMDDQNVFTREVPDAWVAELLGAAELRLGISPELCEAYRQKFGYKLNTMPPVLTPGPEAVPNHWIPGKDQPFTCAMIGNVWTKNQFERLRAAIRGAGIVVHWFGNGPQAAWLGANQDDLEKDGIQTMGFVEESALALLLSSYPLVLVPSGTLDCEDDNPSFSRLSLPSRVLFLVTRANVPILVLGHGETAAGRFVRRLRIGNCCGYSPQSLLAGIELLTDPVRHTKQCRNIKRIAPHLVHPSPGQWIWDSLKAQKPLDAPWTRAFKPRRTWYGRSLESPAPLDVAPWIPGPALTAPSSWPQVKEADLPGFAFTRKHHLALAFGKNMPVSEEEVELGTLNTRLIEGLLLHFGNPKGAWLILGQPSASFLKAVPASVSLWQIERLDDWQATQCQSDESWFVPLGAQNHPSPRPERFDAIVSFQIGSFVREPDVLKFGMWHDFLRRHSAPHTFQAHGFSALLNASFFWAHALHASTRQAFPELKNNPGLDTLLSAPDLWTMKEKAFDLYWRKSIQKSYDEFGHPVGLIVAWRMS